MSWLTDDLAKVAAPLKEKAKVLRDTVVAESKKPKVVVPKATVIIPKLFSPATPEQAAQGKQNLQKAGEEWIRTNDQFASSVKSNVEGFSSFMDKNVGAPIAGALTGVGKSLYENVAEPVGRTAVKPFMQYTGGVAAAPFVGVTELGKALHENVVKPIAKVTTTPALNWLDHDPTVKAVKDSVANGVRIGMDEAKQLFSALNEASVQSKKLEYNAFKNAQPWEKTVLGFSNENYQVYADAAQSSADTFENYQNALEKHHTDPVAVKGALKAGILAMGYMVDMVERPARKTLLPLAWSGISLAGKLGETGQLTSEDVEDSVLWAEYMSGGSVDGLGKTARYLTNIIVGGLVPGAKPFPKDDLMDLVSYTLQTETDFRTRVAAPAIAENFKKKGLYATPEMVEQGFRMQTIFGIPAVSVMDTLVSYSAGLAEAKVAPMLAQLGLTNSAEVLEFTSSMVYPTAVATAVVDNSMKAGLFGKEQQVGLAKWIDANDLDLDQTVSVMNGIAVLGSILKVTGKVWNKAKMFSLGDQKIDWEAVNRDPALIKKILQEFQNTSKVAVSDFTNGRIRAEDVLQLDRIFKSIPQFKDAVAGINLRLYAGNLFDGMAGYASPSTKTMSLEVDTLRTPIKGNMLEADRTITHELAHLLEPGIKADPELGKEWTDLTEGKNWTGKGGLVEGMNYAMKNPAEYFAEGMSKFIKEPDVLKVEDKGLYDFMSKAVDRFSALFTPPKLEFEPNPMYRWMGGEEVKAPDHIVATDDVGRGAHGVPMNMSELAKPMKDFASGDEYVAALRRGDVPAVTALEKFYGADTPDELFAKLEEEAGSKYGDLKSFFDKVKMKPMDVSVSEGAAVPAGLEQLQGQAMRYDTFDAFKADMEKAAAGLQGVPDDVKGTAMQEAIKSAMKTEAGQTLDEAGMQKLWEDSKAMPRMKPPELTTEDVVDAAHMPKELPIVWGSRVEGNPYNALLETYASKLFPDYVKGEDYNLTPKQADELNKAMMADVQKSPDFETTRQSRIIKGLNEATGSDYKTWEDVPDTLTVYRGGTSKDFASGEQVYSFDKTVSSKFAQGFNDGGDMQVRKFTVKKEDIPWVMLAPYDEAAVRLSANQATPTEFMPRMKPDLLEEARKYGSAEEFVKEVNNIWPAVKAGTAKQIGVYPEKVDLFNALRAYQLSNRAALGLELTKLNDDQLTDLWKQSQEFMPRMKETVDRKLLIEKYNVSAEQGQKIEQTLKDLSLDTRTVKSFEQMKAGAAVLLENPELLLRTDPKMLTSDQTVALKQLVNSNFQFITQAEKALQTGDTTDPRLLKAQIDNAQGQINRAISILAPGLTEQGRAVVSNKIMMDKTMDYAYWATKATQALGPNVKDQRLQDVLGAIKELVKDQNRMGLASLMAQLPESGFVDKLVVLWKAGLLTSPSTHIKNMGSNIVFSMFEAIKDVPATAMDKVLAAFTGNRTVSLIGLADQFKGIPKGWLMAQDVMKYGTTLDDLGKAELIRRTNFSDSAMGHAADKYTQFIFRTLGAEDKIFRGRIEYASIAQQAKVTAINEGLKGADFKARVDELISTPTPAMLKIAQADSAYGTFNNDNPISNAISGAKKTMQGNPVGTLALESAAPFVRTPTNVALAIADYSPIGFVKSIAEMAMGKQRAAALDFGRGVTGSLVIGLGALLAQKGMMTGTYPASGDEKKQFTTMGLRGGDLMINGKAYNMMGLSPVGNLLQIGAALYQNTKEEGPQGVVTTAIEGAKGLTEQTFLLGLSSMLKAVTDPKREAKNYVANMISGMIPTVLRQLGEASDKYQRDGNEWYSKLQMGVPGWRQTDQPRLDVFGEPMKTSQEELLGDSANFVSKALVRMVDPFQTREIKSNDLIEEYNRLGEAGIASAYPSVPADKGQKTFTFDDGTQQTIKWTMSPETYNVYQELTGKLMASAQEELIHTEEYQRLDDEDKADQLDKIYKQARTAAFALVSPLVWENPDLYKEMSGPLKSERIQGIKDQMEVKPEWPTRLDKSKLFPRSEKVNELVYGEGPNQPHYSTRSEKGLQSITIHPKQLGVDVYPDKVANAFFAAIADNVPYLESGMGKKMKVAALNNYAFTPEMKKTLSSKVEVSYNPNGSQQGEAGSEMPMRNIDYIPGGEAIAEHIPGELPEFLQRTLITARGDRQQVRTSYNEVSTMAHELFHAAVDINDIDLEAFNRAWELIPSKEKAVIDAHLDSEGLYAGLDDESRANERFAYLGEAKGVGGLMAIPEELRPFYQNILANK